MIVSEIFDGGLIGENCLDTLSDALGRFANPGLSRIIPARARFYIAGVASEKIRQSHRASLNGTNVYSNIWEEPYSLEFLNLCDFSAVTEEVTLFEVDFQSIGSIERCKNFSEDFRVGCVDDGLLDAFIGWFELDLDDVTTLSNAPWKDSCWEQAVFPSRKIVPVRKGSEVLLSAKVVKPTNSQSHFVTLKIQTEPCKSGDCDFTSSSIIRELNDSLVCDYYAKCAAYIKRTAKCLKDVDVLDLSGSPFASLVKAENVSLFSTREPEVGLADYPIVNKEEARRKNMVFDVIIPELILKCGTLSPQGFEELEFWRHFLSKSGICVARRLIVYAMPVSSLFLETNSRVTDPVLVAELDVEVADPINKYQTIHFEDIHLELAEYKSLSSPKKALIIDFEDFWTDRQKTIPFIVNESGNFSAILYWFEVKSFPGISLITKGSASIKKAAYVFRPVSVQAGQSVSVEVRYSPGYLQMYCRG